ncbi:MAG TPA: hypothetical protein VGI77_04055 [Gaiellaceae bacterium]|jgi:hypothetical protein
MLFLAALATASTAHAVGGRSPGAWCGGKEWRLMTLSDADRARVHLDRIPTSVANLDGLKAPRTIGVRRTTGFQLVSWRMQVVVDRYRIASNGEIVLVLFDIPSGKYMNAYLPNPRCLGKKARDRTGVIAAREEFTAHCPAATSQWQLLGASVDISGVGFWNPVHTTRGALPNGAELRPLTNLSIVAGCGIGTG